MERAVERIPIEIPGVEIVGTFNVKCFFDTLYNFQTMKQGVKASVKITRPAGNEQAAQ